MNDKFEISIRERSILRRVQWGATWGLALATVYGLFAALQYLINGPALEAAHGVTLPTVVAVYILGGCIGGALVGLLLPSIRSKLACAVVGIVALLPIAVIVHYSAAGDHAWTPLRIATTIVGPILLGVPLGLSFYDALARAIKKEDRP